MNKKADIFPQFLDNLLSLCNVEKKDSILIGCSGGPDSICLLHLFYRARKKLNLKIIACHINYGLREEEADKDEKLVEKYCKKWKIPLEIRKIYSLKEYSLSNLEEKLREIRYSIFFEIAKNKGCNKIAVAHQKNDQAETLLLNLIRGAGTEGLSAMSLKSEQGVIRPLLYFTRNEIINYLNHYNLQYREDLSNYSINYTRNKIRNLLIPNLQKEYNPNLINILFATSEIVRDEGNFIKEIADKYIKLYAKKEDHFISFPINILILQHKAIQRKIIRFLFKYIAKNTRKLHFSHIEFILDKLKKGEKIKEWHLPNQINFRIDDKSICFYLKDFYDKIKYFEYKQKVPFKLHIEELNKNIESYVVLREEVNNFKTDKSKFYIDYDKCGEELIVRNRRDGDIFKALGAPGKKKLKDYLIDKKIPKEQRDKLILVEAKGDIVAIMGVEINDDYKITDKTKKIIVLRVYERND